MAGTRHDFARKGSQTAVVVVSYVSSIMEHRYSWRTDFPTSKGCSRVASLEKEKGLWLQDDQLLTSSAIQNPTAGTVLSRSYIDEPRRDVAASTGTAGCSSGTCLDCG